jgi:DNA-binding GntR family transcriptional regulator
MGRRRKLSGEDVIEIKRMYAVKDKPWSIAQIARAFHCSTATVNKAINGPLPVWYSPVDAIFDILEGKKK